MSLSDPELVALIDEAIEAGLLKAGHPEVDVARRVSLLGQRSLSAAERVVWERSVLPVLCKPIGDQILIGSLVRRGNRLPRRVGAGRG